MATTSACARFSLEREAAGRYLVRNAAGKRIGLVLGKAGNWLAEGVDGRPLSRFNTRSDAADALANLPSTRISHTQSRASK